MLKASMLATAITFALIGGATAMARPLSAEKEALIKPDGKAESCIPLSRIRETRVRNDSTIDFYLTGKKVYRNTLPDRCPQLGFEEKFSYAPSIHQLCSTDIIHVIVGNGEISGSACGLGQFQPVSGAPK